MPLNPSRALLECVHYKNIIIILIKYILFCNIYICNINKISLFLSLITILYTLYIRGENDAQ